MTARRTPLLSPPPSPSSFFAKNRSACRVFRFFFSFPFFWIRRTDDRSRGSSWRGGVRARAPSGKEALALILPSPSPSRASLRSSWGASTHLQGAGGLRAFGLRERLVEPSMPSHNDKSRRVGHLLPQKAKGILFWVSNLFLPPHRPRSAIFSVGFSSFSFFLFTCILSAQNSHF